jgi:hypothetical protein
LSIELVDEEGFLLFIVIVKSGFDGGKDVVWFKTDNIVQEASELINFTLYLYNRSSIFLYKIDMTLNLLFEIMGAIPILVN